MVITIRDLLPIPRFDGKPFVRAEIQEAPEPVGEWTTIETVVFVDPDVDPRMPQLRSVTTEDAVDPANNWYRVIFSDLDGDMQVPTQPMSLADAPIMAYRPSVTDIGNLMRVRTRDDAGNQLGTFTQKTRPTGEQVSQLIDTAMRAVAVIVGNDIPDVFNEHVSYLVALKTGMLIELSYFPEQLGTPQSLYDRLKVLYDEMLVSTREAILSYNENDEIADDIGPGYPFFNFPVDEGGMIGWKTVM